MYVIQVNFKDSRLLLRYTNMCVVDTEQDIVDKVKCRKKHFECEVYTRQEPAIQEAMAQHWVKLEHDTQENLDVLRYCITHNNYVLLFPVFKLCEIRADGGFGKFKDALIINDRVYLLKEANKNGEFVTVEPLVHSSKEAL